eukprot:COSAG04_NODE_887_length_9615_cov_16.346574_4_plen_85_part_00
MLWTVARLLNPNWKVHRGSSDMFANAPCSAVRDWMKQSPGLSRIGTAPGSRSLPSPLAERALMSIRPWRCEPGSIQRELIALPS